MEFILHNLIGSVQRFRASWRTLEHQPLPWKMSSRTAWHLLHYLRQDTLSWFLLEDEAAWFFFFEDLTGSDSSSRPLLGILNKTLDIVAFLGP